ncbi:MAG: serine protease [Candidatus Pacebacteria bacterium]|jgi:hypothetical protein|nr:serine protease [Candidatus Paceibacterota bacterium]
MNIEELTKTQIILLTLLVSFVTSIATGIVTVTLLEQAPPVVTQTVNRVVQNTIEKAIPQEGGKTIETVIIKEEDLVVDAVGQSAKSLVAIRDYANSQEGAFLGVGFFASKDGLVFIDGALVNESGQYVVLSNGVSYPAEVATKNEKGFAILKILPVKNEQGNSKSFSSAVFTNTAILKVGQTLVSPSSPDGISLNVAKGTISRIQEATDASGVITDIDLLMNLGKASSGAPLLDTEGSVIGIVLVRDGEPNVVLARDLKTALQSIATQRE